MFWDLLVFSASPASKIAEDSIGGAFWTMHQHQQLPVERHRDSSSKVQVGMVLRMVEMVEVETDLFWLGCIKNNLRDFGGDICRCFVFSLFF